ncbi:hypothetical protein Psyc_1015 [Psychrobacter arcticus 273-4]|uniref:Uncharacterized protein n=1 Tax=Psychrobacter arcticus (strain DSM 17307 / VKM B-2377 / 273-4) TaxID=259536 RepID=Q4FSZ0_PSYA2|nr:hypothetical protein [Psychrobacter arcticus]AAZ18868.1 hypothetical protein Psyc_1015 [Psychrobacter arcticus 273-4]
MKLSQYIIELQKMQAEHGDIEVLYVDDVGWADENYNSLEDVPTVTYFENLERDMGKECAKMIHDENKLPPNHAYTPAYIMQGY